jgi:hypothetical protein
VYNRASRLIAILFLFLAATVCHSREPEKYALYEGSRSADSVASVKFNRISGALLLLSFDGKDPRSFSSMAKYAELVRNGEAKTPPDRKPGMINFSPGRNEPQLVGVAPGTHKYGVLYMLIANVRGGLILENQMAKDLAAKYLPGKQQFNGYAITVKHYEDISFVAEAGKNYRFGYSWSKESLELHITLQECSTKWKECSPVPFQSENPQTKVLGGATDQEI